MAITIVVVEDERKTADTIRRYLEHAGYGRGGVFR
jgi:DNA-binding response OmpR family regulator